MKNQMIRLSENIKRFNDINQIDFMIDAIYDFGNDDVDNEIKKIKELNEILECGIEGLGNDSIKADTITSGITISKTACKLKELTLDDIVNKVLEEHANRIERGYGLSFR